MLTTSSSFMLTSSSASSEVRQPNRWWTSVLTLLLLSCDFSGTNTKSDLIDGPLLDQHKGTSVIATRCAHTGARKRQNCMAGGAAAAPSQKIHTIVDEMPHYPAEHCVDGDTSCYADALNDYLLAQLRYPSSGICFEGLAVVRLVVNTDGQLLDPVVVRNPLRDASEASEELERILLDLIAGMPAWTPGRLEGESVQTYVHLPVEFRLE